MPKLICPVCDSEFERTQLYLDKIKGTPTCSNDCRFELRRIEGAKRLHKVCCTCKQDKPLDEFSPKPSNCDGRSSQCKQCTANHMRQYRQKNPEKAREISQRYYKRYKDKMLDRRRAKYRNNREQREKILIRAAEYREQHREEINQWHREYREANLEKRKTKDRRYYHANKEEIRQRRKEYRQRPEVHRRVLTLNRHRKTRRHNLPNTFTEEHWQYALDYWGGCCAICGRPAGLWHNIVMDHWIPLSSSKCPGTIPTNIVPLCHGIDGCNNSKHNRNPKRWLIKTLGTKKGQDKLETIEKYFASLLP